MSRYEEDSDSSFGSDAEGYGACDGCGLCFVDVHRCVVDCEHENCTETAGYTYGDLCTKCRAKHILKARKKQCRHCQQPFSEAFMKEHFSSSLRAKIDAVLAAAAK